MKKLLKVVLEELGLIENESLFYERKRQALSHRLHWIFFMDALEGHFDSMTRRVLGHEKRHRVLSR